MVNWPFRVLAGYQFLSLRASWQDHGCQIVGDLYSAPGAPCERVCVWVVQRHARCAETSVWCCLAAKAKPDNKMVVQARLETVQGLWDGHEGSPFTLPFVSRQMVAGAQQPRLRHWRRRWTSTTAARPMRSRTHCGW